MSTIDKAICLATEAFQHTHDKGGSPYIYHCLRVMLAVDAYDEKMAAVLHDVVEDSDWTLEALLGEGFPSHVVEAIDALTRREDEQYIDFIHRARRNPIARKVKIADLRDNLDVTRLPYLGDVDRLRINKYLKSLQILEQAGGVSWEELKEELE